MSRYEWSRHSNTILLPNQLRLAYELWANYQPAPIDARLGIKYQQAYSASSTSSGSSVSSVAASSLDPTPSPEPAPSAHALTTDAVEHLNILAIHNRHDNAASFDKLVPFLFTALARDSSSSSSSSSSTAPNPLPPRVQVCCIDLAGRGKSQWRNLDSPYSLVNDISDMHHLLNVLHWKEYMIMGHAQGAVISMILAGTQTLMVPPLPSIPFPPLLLGAIFLDPFDYHSWSIPNGSDAAYTETLSVQSPPNAIARVLESRYHLRHERRPLFASRDEAINELAREFPEMEDESLAIIMKRGLRLVKRSKLASSTTLAPSEKELDPTSADKLESGRDFNPDTEEVGWSLRIDPAIDAVVPTEFARSQIQTAVRFLASPSLILHARTIESNRDPAFSRHVDSMLVDSIFQLKIGHGLGEVYDIVSDGYLHLDEESAEEVSALVAQFVKEKWENRAATRKEGAARRQRILQKTKDAKAKSAAAEAANKKKPVAKL